VKQLILTALLLGACSTEPQPELLPEPTGPLSVTTVSFPAQWLTERVGGSHVQARNILPAGQDAPHWRPEAELIAGLSQSDLIVANGAGFEGWMATATLPSDKVVYTARNVQLIEGEAATHSHGSGGEHSHAGIDPHTWGSPSVFAQQGRELAASLSLADPGHTPSYNGAAEALEAELQQLGQAYAEAFSHAKGTKLAASHPAFRYLAREVGVEIQAFDYHPDELPSAEQIEAFTRWAGRAEAPVLLWEAVPTSEVKAAFPEGVRHVYLDPLEQPGNDGRYDYITQVKANIATIEALFPAPPLEANKTPGKAPPKPGAPATAKPEPKKLKEKGIKGTR
jgi:zinc transport system substrate-binding protein